MTFNDENPSLTIVYAQAHNLSHGWCALKHSNPLIFELATCLRVAACDV
jgi:hypothetical protein